MKKRYDDRIHKKLCEKGQELKMVLNSILDFADDAGDGHLRDFVICVGRKAPIVNTRKPRLYCIYIAYIRDGVPYNIIKPVYNELNNSNIDEYLDKISSILYELADAYAGSTLEKFDKDFFNSVKSGEIQQAKEDFMVRMSTKQLSQGGLK